MFAGATNQQGEGGDVEQMRLAMQMTGVQHSAEVDEEGEGIDEEEDDEDESEEGENNGTGSGGYAKFRRFVDAKGAGSDRQRGREREQRGREREPHVNRQRGSRAQLGCRNGRDGQLHASSQGG